MTVQHGDDRIAKVMARKVKTNPEAALRMVRAAYEKAFKALEVAKEIEQGYVKAMRR